MTMNRMANARNPYQGMYKRVLCVCSAGLLRSPTAAFVLSQPPYNFNTRAAGISQDYALIPVDEVLLHWADRIVCMNEDHAVFINDSLETRGLTKEVVCLNIPDNFEYRNEELIELIKSRYDNMTKGNYEET